MARHQTTVGGPDADKLHPSRAQTAGTSDVQLQNDSISGEPENTGGRGAQTASLPLQFLFSGQQYVSLTISPPKIAPRRNPGSETQSALDIHTPEFPIASLSFGQTQALRPIAESKQNTFKGSRSERKPNPSPFSLTPEQTQDVISPRMMRTYRHLRSTCKKLLETEGDTPIEAPVERRVLSFGQTEDPQQLASTCRSFVTMNRDEAMKQMAKRLHKH
jgi:hypothetical protein